MRLNFHDNRQDLRGCCAVRAYIIADGGAGSSARPAFDSGTFTRANIIVANTTKPTRYDGCSRTSGMGFSAKLNVAFTRPINASPVIKPDAARIPTFSTRVRCASL